MWRCAMKKNLTRTDVFYYSRRKLALYLLFNLGLLTLALFFTWVIFPQYGLVYSFAVGTCLCRLPQRRPSLSSIIRWPSLRPHQ